MVLLNVVSISQNICILHMDIVDWSSVAAKLFHVGDKTKAQLSIPKGKKRFCAWYMNIGYIKHFVDTTIYRFSKNKLWTHLDHILWLGNWEGVILLAEKKWHHNFAFWWVLKTHLIVIIIHDWFAAFSCVPVGLGSCQLTALPVSSWCVSENVIF